MPYDPRQHGARCDVCPLRTNNIGGPVAPEVSASPEATVVTDYPAKEDAELGRMLVGAAGQMLTKHTQMHGLQRGDFNYNSALLCRPPGADMDKVRRKLKIINKRRVKEGKAELPDPVACCRPRLLNDLKASPNVLPLGNLALEAVTGHKMSAMKYRGAPMTIHVEGAEKRIVPLLHPSFVNVMRSWMRAFHVDVMRAVRWFRGEVDWVEPPTNYHPTVAELAAFLQRNRKISHDWETERKGQLTSQVYCLSLAGHSEAMLVPFMSIDGHTRYYAPDDEVEIRHLIAAAMCDPEKLWISQNGRVFDNIVSKRIFGVEPKRHADTIMFHRSVESELPHKLEYIASVWTSLPGAWKATRAGTEAKTDRELHEYSIIDATVTYRVLEPLAQAAIARGQAHIVKKDHQLQDVCADMHRNGMKVDFKKRDEWDVKLRKKVITTRSAIRDLLLAEMTPEQAAKFKPSSTRQVADLLYEKWKLPIYVRSEKTDEPSTDDEALLRLRLDAGLSERQILLIDALRQNRRAASARSTRIARLRYRDEGLIVNDGEMLPDWELSTEEKRQFGVFDELDEEKVGLILADGRFHPSWMPHAAPTGRFGAQLVQNWPRLMRDIFIAGPGNVLIGLDADQGELRWSTNLSGAKLYLDCFKAKGDPHTLNGLLVLGEQGRRLYEQAKAIYGTDKLARKKHEEWARAVDFAKRQVFASQYKAGIKTIYATLRAADNDEGVLLNPNLKLDVVQRNYERWLAQVPEFAKWWADDLEEYRSSGYLLSPFWLRRRDFADGENEQEIANFKCQSGLADVVNEGTLEAVKRIPYNGKYGPGLINQVHDALLFEVKAEYAEEVMQIMVECLTRSVPGFEVPFTFSGHIGWKLDKDGNKLDPLSRWSFAE
jgi:uracil-DNA glycosylase family 4